MSGNEDDDEVADEENVDWEGDDSDCKSTPQSEANQIVCTIKIHNQPEQKPKQKRKRMIKYLDEDFDSALICHQQSLADAVSECVVIATAAFAPGTAQAMLSLFTMEHVNLNRHKISERDKDIREVIARIGRWIKAEFRTLPLNDVSAEEGRDGCSEGDLHSFVLRNKAGTSHQINQLYCALLHGLGYSVRYVRTVDGGSVHPSENPAIYKERWVAMNPESIEQFKLRKVPPTPAVLSWLEVSMHCQQSYGGKDAPGSSSSSDVIDLTDEADEPPAMSPNHAQERSSGGGARWVQVDLQHGLLDRPEAVEATLRKGKALQYVLAMECAGAGGSSSSSSSSGAHNSGGGVLGGYVLLTDVTADYRRLHRHSTAWERQTRTEVDGWMQQLLDETNSSVIDLLRPSFNKRGTVDADGVMDLTEMEGDGEDNSSSSRYYPHAKRQKLATAAASSSSSSGSSSGRSGSMSSSCPLPTRVADFKDHPVYLLERHLLSEQMLHPTARAVALFKGESVYLQAHKEALRTKLQWRRQLRQVRRGEESVRVVKRNVISHTAGEDGGREETKVLELRLFGVWQTEPIEVSRFVLSLAIDYIDFNVSLLCMYYRSLPLWTV